MYLQLHELHQWVESETKERDVNEWHFQILAATLLSLPIALSLYEKHMAFLQEGFYQLGYMIGLYTCLCVRDFLRQFRILVVS